MRHNTAYTLIFATIICVGCGVLVSSAAVSLKDRQKFNAELDKKKKVLEAAGLTGEDEKVTPERVDELFGNIETLGVELKTGDLVADLAADYDQLKAAADPATSFEAPSNRSAIKRLPNVAQVFKVLKDDGSLDMYVLPIEGLGLWGTLYGFLALDADLNTVRGITYYTHKETPGLGGEVDNPRWKASWPGRKVFGENGDVQLAVIKGQAGSPEAAPYAVDGLSGATITSNGVTFMIDFWLGENGFGPFLESVS
ncbi:MAG: Na(+)-translocating NADH-quinone reductase subunit C [Acidobacteriota bacterium]